MNTQSRLLTLGDVARHLGVSRHVVSYVVEQHNIEETQRAGIIRLYDEPTVERIERVLRRTRGLRGSDHAYE